MMPSPSKPLGVLRPLGGGDPIPLTKDELVIGRRPSCDIRLNFDNISGKHCQLRYFQGVWHVRDLGSTNGTTVNGQAAGNDHSVMPDDQLKLASHTFTIDYDPAVAPGSLIDANQFLDLEGAGEEVETHRPRSLLELAGLESPESSRRRSVPAPPPSPEDDAETEFEAVDFEDSVPEEFQEEPPAASAAVGPTDEDFFDMIRADVEDDNDPPRPKRR